MNIKRYGFTENSSETRINPKLEDSGIIDCIPQTGKCPNNCQECYFNSSGFFRTKDTPLIPTLEEVGDKLVRINSGHDSNLQKELVLKVTEQYPKKFYNTSLPNFYFPAPVTFTCNGRDTDYSAMMVAKNLENVMMVRFRTNLWNLDLLDGVVRYYVSLKGIPVTITFMRYTDLNNVPSEFRKFYGLGKSILNMYYRLCGEKWKEVAENYFREDKLVGVCATPESSYCRDCGRCEFLYNRFVYRRKWNDLIEEIKV